MKPEDVTVLVSYRMEKSKEAIRAAEILLENEMLSFSINRVYYSMFYAVQALLAADGVSFSVAVHGLKLVEAKRRSRSSGSKIPPTGEIGK